MERGDKPEMAAPDYSGAVALTCYNVYRNTGERGEDRNKTGENRTVALCINGRIIMPSFVTYKY